MAFNISTDLFHGPNAGYALELYELYRKDPDAVDAGTRAYFEAAGARPNEAAAPPPAPAADPDKVVGLARIARLTREYGYLGARLDPLGSPPPGDYELELDTHDLSEADLERLPASVISGPLSEGAPNALVALRRLQAVYSGSVGYDFAHVHNAQERDWLRHTIESNACAQEPDAERERELLARLSEVEGFERFLHRSYPGQKWFSIEGLDMLVPLLDEIIYHAVEAGTREVVMGMAHRGRLNVLAHILEQPYERILSGFKHSADRSEGASGSDLEPDDTGSTGDVKYHLGAVHRRSGAAGAEMPITLVPNPSHLEFVDPLVVGRARAAQEDRSQPGPPRQDETASLPILVHGDAAFPGQGVVAETLSLSRLEGYRTGGTIHIIANNQLGFTSDPHETRSTLFASDLAKGFEIPIAHVNADDPHACLMVARLAHTYRNRFQKDFLIDLIGYRRYGHNETDEPAFTQPEMYSIVPEHPTVREQLARRLAERGVVGEDEARAMMERVQERMREAQRLSAPDGSGESGVAPHLADEHAHPEDLVPPRTLRELNAALHTLPEGFEPNPKLARWLERRRGALDEGRIDWSHAEALAFAASLAGGTPIRLTGQDTERGTFSQRHMVLHDARDGDLHVPLQALDRARAAFAVYNSPLSENAALGFEYGYSTHTPETLVLWEAQFGDFINGAQVIVDQFLVSGRAKWNQSTGLVLLLPHGHEGQGPEHSSARLERFLQEAANNNIRVANVSTAAQYYHLLRRQVKLLGADPRPLVVMTPKSLLRNPLASSSLEDLTETTFQPVLDDARVAQRRDVRRVLLCSGKVYYDLIGSPLYEEVESVAIVRIEELYPFPAPRVAEVLRSYPNLEELVWVQEEPRNMGAWVYITGRLREMSEDWATISYVGRSKRASPAEGSIDLHNAEQARIVQAALSEPPDLAYSGRREGVRYAG